MKQPSTISEIVQHLHNRRWTSGRIFVSMGPCLLLGAAPSSAAHADSMGIPRPDAALINKGDIGIATYAMLFVIVVLLIDRWLDRRAIGKLADAIDRSNKTEGDRHTAMLVQLSVLASALGRSVPDVRPPSTSDGGAHEPH